MSVEKMTDEGIDRRMDLLEQLIARADTEDLPALNAAFQRLLAEQVRRDLESQEGRPA